MISYDYRSASRPIKIDKEAIRKLVDDVLVPDVIAWLKRQDQDKPIGARQNIATTTLKVHPVGGRMPFAVTVYVRSVPKNVAEAVVTGSAGALPWDWMDDEQRVELILNLNGRLTPAEYLNERLSANSSDRKYIPYGLYSVLIHELTHVMETPFMRETGYERDEEGHLTDATQYVNSPVEVRAFMQQIVDEALIWAKRRPARMGKTNRSLIDQVLRYSPTWQRVHPRMSAPNRNKILSAVYDALDKAGLLFDA